MTRERRRRMIVEAALDLAAERGAAMSTLQVALAAGIGEATIFRAFRDKDELLEAIAAEALRPEPLLAAISAIPLDQPLAARLTDAADLLAAHLHRLGTVLGALHASGHHAGRRPAPGQREAAAGPAREALSRLLEPARASLRQPPERLAEVFAGLLLARARIGMTTPELVDLFLNGALEGPA
jgi:AcrR family transcriptional regulator